MAYSSSSVNRRVIRLLTAVAGAILILLVLSFWTKQPPPQSPVTPSATSTFVASEAIAVAVITKLDGSATVSRDGILNSATLNMRLDVGDLVEVSPTSTLTVTWTTYGRSLLAGGTRLAINRASESGDKTTLRVRLKLDAGRVWTRLQRLLSSDSAFEIRANNVVATVRGTSFGIGIENGGRVKVQVMESHVSVSRVQDVANKEETVGAAVIVEPKREVTVSIEAAKPIPAPQAISAVESRDLFLLEGHGEISQIESEEKTATVNPGPPQTATVNPGPPQTTSQQMPKNTPTNAIPALRDAQEPRSITAPVPIAPVPTQPTQPRITDPDSIENYLIKDPNAKAQWTTTSTQY